MKYTEEDLGTITDSMIRGESFKDISNRVKHPTTSLLARIQKITKENQKQFKGGRINMHIKNIIREGWRIYYRSYLSRLGLSEKQFEEIILLSHVVPREKLAGRYGINYFALVKVIQLKEAEYPFAEALDHKRGKNLIERARELYNQGPMNIQPLIKKEVFKHFKSRLVKEAEEMAVNDVDGYLALWYAIKNSEHKTRVDETKLKYRVSNIVDKAFSDYLKNKLGYDQIKEKIKEYMLLYCSEHFQNIRTRIKGASKILDKRQYEVISLRYGLDGYEPQSLRKIIYRKDLGFNKPRSVWGISLIEKSAVKKMSGFLNEERELN